MQPMELFPDGQSGRMSQGLYPPIEELISQQSFIKWGKQGRWTNGGISLMHNFSEYPSADGAFSSSLALILQPPQDVQKRYYLSPKACQGILRRANRRGKVLPARLQRALEEMVLSSGQELEVAVNGGMGETRQEL